MSAGSAADIPPPSLLARIGPTEDPASESGREFFDATGRDRKRAIIEALPGGYSFEGRRVLDFGCGAGRILRHFKPEASRAEFWGCDLHEPSIAWLERNLSPPMQFFVNRARPLPQPDGYFDLVYAVSVFTHITHDWSDWLLELHRVLKPGGYLLATLKSAPATWEWSALRPLKADELGMAVLGLHRQIANTSGPIVIHSPWWIRSRWGRAFELITLQEDGFVDPGKGHGFVVGRKRDVALTKEDLERPNIDDPRELAAQRTQIALLEENAARVGEEIRRQREYIAELQAALERQREHISELQGALQHRGRRWSRRGLRRRS
jgi:SAM-dependent methyltransferase